MKAIEFTSKPHDQEIKPATAKPESARTSGLPIFRLPFTNLKTKKPEDSPLILNAESPGKTPRPKAKINIDLGLQSSLKLETQQKTSTESFGFTLQPKANSHRLVNSSGESVSTRNDTIMSPTARKTGHSETIIVKVKSSNLPNTNSPKPFLRIPISDLYKEPMMKVKRSFTSATASTYDDNQLMSEQSPLNPPEEIEEDQQDCTEKDNKFTLTLCSTMESSGQSPPQRVGSLNHLNITGSPADNHRKLGPCKTLKDLGIATTFNSPKGDAIVTGRRRFVKMRPTSNGSEECLSGKKTSKTANKITDAFEKAKLYNDQVILQHQFNKQNEEEERDFCDLYELLQSNIREL